MWTQYNLQLAAVIRDSTVRPGDSVILETSRKQMWKGHTDSSCEI